MKKFFAGCFITALFMIVMKTIPSIAKQQTDGYILQHEKDIAKREPGPHNGGGLSTAYSFFSNTKDFQIVFRKRVLYPGASIGYHLQEWDEIYYILQGSGEMQMNGKTFPVTTGDCILTRPGSSHGLKPAGNDSLVVLINYLQH